MAGACTVGTGTAGVAGAAPDADAEEATAGTAATAAEASGAGASAGGSKVQINHLSAGRIPQGAQVERSVPTPLNEGDTINLGLNASDFQTARKVAQAINANSDNLPDFLLMGNFYDCNVQMGRYDADYGTLLVNKGKGAFEVKPLGISIKGQVKRLQSIKIQGKTYILVVRNNDTLMVLSQV